MAQPGIRIVLRSMACVALAMLSCGFAPRASAQAGPPMITNDPDTPGPGAWEINLAATGGRVHGDWNVAAPDVDINRGIGDRIQLSVHGSWAHARDDAGWMSGLGDVELGLRWRFLDQETSGVSMAVQPLWIRGWSASARRKGLAAHDPEYVLPLQAARDFGATSVGIEIARHFAMHAPDAWQAGMFAAHPCFGAMTCLAEINATRDDGGSAATTLNFGARKPLRKNLLLMGSLGSEVSGTDRQPLVFYLGVQMLR